jgi:hypothetical protein
MNLDQFTLSLFLNSSMFSLAQLPRFVTFLALAELIIASYCAEKR